jgi:hypothetical protein
MKPRFTVGNVLAITIVLGSAFSLTAIAGEIICNKQQTTCLTTSTQMTIGDEIGIFNRDGEVVATGEVKSMKGERRAVLINERHGRINKGYELALLKASPSSSEFQSTYKIYKEPSKVNIGASLGLVSIGIGEGSSGAEVSGYASFRKWRGIQVIGRGTYFKMNGSITGYDESDNISSRPMTLTGFGLLGGAAYAVRENKKIAFRGELGLGTMYVGAKIAEDPSLINDANYNTKIKNGFGLYGRGSLGAIYNMDIWHLHLDVAESLIHKAMATAIVMGASRDLK